MKGYIENFGSYSGLCFDNDGDLAIVLESPPPLAKKGLLTTEIENWIVKTFGKRLASVHVIYPHQKDKKKVQLRELRIGWKRVYTEIKTLSPTVKRILIMGGSEVINKVIVPGIDKGLADIHGTIFTLPCGLEVVPTWNKVFPHMRKWFERDIERFKTLIKDKQPLTYQSTIKDIWSNKLVVDLETSGLTSWDNYITTLGIRFNTGRALIIGNDKVQEAIKFLIDCLYNGIQIWMHNAQFDSGFLGQDFIDAARETGNVHCTLIRSRSDGELVNSLKHLGILYTDRPGNYAWIKGEFRFDDTSYVCEDLETTWQLSNKYDSFNPPVVQLMEEAIIMAAEQTIKGSALDVGKLDTLAEDGAKLVWELRDELTQKYGVDPGSNKDLIPVLQARGYEFHKLTDKGEFALDVEVLTELGLTDIVEFRQAQKLDSTFIGKMKSLIRADGTIPHHQNILAARTGRTTMSNYNHQQSGKKGPVKKLLISRFEGGSIFSVDLAQAELRVNCYLTNDEQMAAWLLRGDAHRENAANAFGIAKEDVTEDQRFEAKAIVFKATYAGRPVTAGEKRVYVYLRKEFKKLFKWIDSQFELGKNAQFVTEAFGKKINLTDIQDYKGKWAAGRVAVNGPVQGTASNIAIWLTVRLWKLFKKHNLQSLVLFGIHDSIVGDIHPDEIDIVIKLVQQAFADISVYCPIYNNYPLMKVLGIEGELQIAANWFDTKSAIKIACSSLGV